MEFGVDRDEAAAELVALADLDQPGVVLGAVVAERQQLLEHDGDLLAVRRAERIELHRMLADRQLLVVRRAGDRAVDVGEAAAVGLVPGPDLGRDIIGGVGHPGALLTVLWHGPRGRGAGLQSIMGVCAALNSAPHAYTASGAWARPTFLHLAHKSNVAARDY